MAVDLKPHNLETYVRVKEIFKTKNRACCVQPTGSGKSYLALKLFEDNSSARKLVLEPQHYIREQLQSKVTEEMGEVQFITYSKLAKMSDEDIAALEPDIIVLDEFHRAGAKEWGGKGVQRLLESYPESKVLGLSATPIRYLDSGRNMAEELFEGAMANNISLAEAIVQRILPLPRYITGLYCLNGEIESINKKIEQSYNSPEEKKALLRQVQEMKKQLDKSNGVSSILHKYILEPNGKYIVFCKDIKHLNQMKPMLEQWFVEAGFTDVRLYVVHSKNENKDAEFKKFKDDDGDGIRLCLVVSMLNEGVHVDDIDGVIMLRNTISAGLFFQQIGRAISCNSKGIPLILDLVANAQSVTACNLKTDIEKAIQKEKERNKGFSSEGLEVEKFFVMDQVLDVISAFKGIEERLIDGKTWSDEEYETLYKYFPVEGIKVENRLNNRTRTAIFSMASRLGISAPDTKWSYEEIELLKKYYPKYGAKTVKYLKNRPLSSIQDKANSLGIFVETVEIFDKEEDEIIRKYYPTEGSAVYKRLKDKTGLQCRGRAQKLGISYIDSRKWTREEDEIIKNYYIKKPQVVQEKLKNRSINQIANRASKLNARKSITYWTQEEDDILKKYYLSEKSNVFKRLNGRSKNACTIRARVLGITQSTNIPWSDKDYSILKEFYPKIGSNVSSMLNRSKESCQAMASKLGIRARENPVSIIEVDNNQVIKTYPSEMDAGRALHEEFHVVDNDKAGWLAIHRRLIGKIKNPIYKSRFIFQYADTPDQSEPA